MRKFLANASVAALLGAGMSAAVAAGPAEAATYFHGGGWGGGWRGGAWGGGYSRGGYGGYWGGGYWGPGWGYAGWGYPYWGYPYPWWGYNAPVVAGDAYYAEDARCWTYRKVWSRPGGHGHYLGRYPVNRCQ